MSLAHHVSQTEGIDKIADDDVDVASLILTKQLSHRLSYDILPNHPTQLPIPEKLDGVGAYEISTSRRIAQIIIACLACVLAAGITFGYAAIKPILLDQKVYRNSCTQSELDRNVPICYLQDQRLNLLFIIASVTSNVGALAVGTILDRYGPRVCGYISVVLLVAGSLCMAFSMSLPFDALLLGNFSLALGGTFVFLPFFHLSNAFPQYSGLILSCITGAFDASAAFFVLFRRTYFATNGRFGLREFFLLYLTVPAFILVAQLFIMPARSYDTRTELEVKMEIAEDPANDVHDSDAELSDEAEIWKARIDRSSMRKASIASLQQVLGTQEQRLEHEKKEEEIKIASGVWGALHGMPAYKQMQTPWFILITIFTVLQMSRFNFFIATLWSQYDYMLQDPNLATKINDFFDLALPIGGILTVPFIGAVLDNLSTLAVLSLIVLLSTVYGVLQATPTYWAGYGTICIFVVLRPLYYSAISDYTAKVFGFQTFGTVYGAIACIAGLGVFSQSGLQALVHSVFQEDPGPMNLWLAGIGLIIGVSLVLYVDMQGRRVRMEASAEADEYERRSVRRGSRRASRSSTIRDSVIRDSVIRETALLDPERRPLLNRGLSTVRESADEPGEREDED